MEIYDPGSAGDLGSSAEIASGRIGDPSKSNLPVELSLDPCIREAQLKWLETARKLDLVASSNLGEKEVIDELLREWGRTDDVECKLALAEAYRRGWFARARKEMEKLCTGIPPDAPVSRLLKRMGIRVRERSLHCPTAAVKLDEYIRRNGLTNTAFATRAGVNEKTIRNFLESARADRGTLVRLAQSMGVSLPKLLT